MIPVLDPLLGAGVVASSIGDAVDLAEDLLFVLLPLFMFVIVPAVIMVLGTWVASRFQRR